MSQHKHHPKLNHEQLFFLNIFTPQDMRFNPPTFDAATVADKVADEYGLTGEWAPLIGERDQNFRLSAEDGHKFVVKIAGPDEDPDVADFQVQALLFLEKGSPRIPVPRIVRAKTGRCLSELDHNLVVERLRAACGM